MNYLNRINLLKQDFKLLKNQYLLINDVTNIFYLTGYNASNAYILLGEKNYFFTDNRYYAECKNKIKHFEIKLLNDKINLLFKKLNVKKLIIFKDSINFNLFSILSDIFKIKISKNDLSYYRVLKDDIEIKNIKKSCKLICNSIKRIFDIIKPGIRETELKTELDYQINKLNNSSGTAFETIVLFGKKTAFPHGHSSKNIKLKKNDIILIDAGSNYNFYKSDITRMFSIGKINDDFLKKYKLIQKIKKEVIFNIIKYKKISKIENYILQQLQNYKLDKYYLHSTGHGVGLEIHENPVINKINQTKLKNNSVFTIEPGIYLENKFGIRIEDTILYSKNKIMNLTGQYLSDNLINL